MDSSKKTISVMYSDEKLRILVEEYITMQKSEFTFKGVCSYILYRAMEEERTTNKGLYNTDQLSQFDCRRLSEILKRIMGENRISKASIYSADFSDDTIFFKVKN